MDAQLRKNVISASKMMIFDTQAVKDPQYKPYNGLQSLQQFDNSLQKQMNQVTITSENNRNIKQEGSNTGEKIKINGDVVNAKINALLNQIKLAISRLDKFIHRSQIQLLQITSTQAKEVPTTGINFDKWIYLEKFQRDFQRLIVDLKSKRQFIIILQSKVENKEDLISVENWIQAINIKYISELEKHLNFGQWKQYFNNTDQEYFKLLVNAAKADPEILKNLKKQRQNSNIGCNKNSSVQSNISRSELNIHGTRQGNTVLRASEAVVKPNNNPFVNNQQHVNIFTKKTQQMSKSANYTSNIQPIQKNMTSSLNSENKRGSQIDSQKYNQSKKNYYIEYSDAQTLKTSQLKKLFQQNGLNMSLTQSFVADEYEPVVVTPYTLAGSYHPMSQSQLSHHSHRSITSIHSVQN